MLNDSAQDLIAKFPLGHVAMIYPDGRPCVSPKGAFLVLDKQSLAFAGRREAMDMIRFGGEK